MRIIPPEDLDLVVQALEAGELVVVPTSRWYMICANARDRRICDQIFTGKRRPQSKSLAYVLPDLSIANRLFVMTSAAHRLASAFWPGELAMILRWRDRSWGRRHDAVGSPNALVTLDSGILGELARRSQVPIAATTASISGQTDTDAAGPAITTLEVGEFVTESGLSVAYCIDGGICPLAHHLTIVDCTTSDAVLLRPGVLHERAIRAALATASPLDV